MGYSVRWVEENLGITRDMIRYYEKEKLIPKDSTRNNPTNNYRNFSDEDIERLWGIRLLIGIGFTAKEILALMNDPHFDFETAIAKKVAKLEQEHDKNVIYLEFAKSIKFSGRIPTATSIGNVRFDEFLEHVHENWNFYSDPRSAPFMKTVDTLIAKPAQEWNPDDMNHLLTLFEKLDIEGTMHACTLHAYFQVIADMKEFGYNNNLVQRVVQLMHEYWVQHNPTPELDGKITPEFLAKYIAPSFLDGDISLLYKRNYGENGSTFIAYALAYYGGLDIKDL